MSRETGRRLRHKRRENSRIGVGLIVFVVVMIAALVIVLEVVTQH